MVLPSGDLSSVPNDLVPIDIPISVQLVFREHRFSLLLVRITPKCCGEERDGWDQMCRSCGWDLIEFSTERGCGREVDKTLDWEELPPCGHTVISGTWEHAQIGACVNMAEGELQTQFKITVKSRKLFTVTTNRHFFCLELED